MANISIQPVQIWSNGQTIAGNNLDAYQIYNNGVSESNFYYQVQKDKQSLASGNVSILGFDYDNWKIYNFSTEWALSFICSKLNLTPIIPTTEKK
jgi:hypothetical protein